MCVCVFNLKKKTHMYNYLHESGIEKTRAQYRAFHGQASICITSVLRNLRIKSIQIGWKPSNVVYVACRTSILIKICHEDTMRRKDVVASIGSKGVEKKEVVIRVIFIDYNFYYCYYHYH